VHGAESGTIIGELKSEKMKHLYTIGILNNCGDAPHLAGQIAAEMPGFGTKFRVNA